MVHSMWLFKRKFYADGTLSRYKACLVANDSTQQFGVNFDKTFSLVVKPATINTVLSLVVSRKWPIHQLDVKNVFLNGDLSETVYMHQPPDFVDARLCHMSQILSQSLRLLSIYLLLYVDDIILTAYSTTLLQQLIDSLHREFDMTDLGALNYFLGISVVRHSTGTDKAKIARKQTNTDTGTEEHAKSQKKTIKKSAVVNPQSTLGQSHNKTKILKLPNSPS
ncbi:ribonuclease H-like domain-containing protein [Tanacetum coccineum]